MRRDPGALAYAIETSCRDKARVVMADEREAGVRALLNFGHTFGHAIEGAMGYGRWLHGEAVAAGMLMAARLSERLGWLAAGEGERLRALIQRARLPLEPPAIAPQRFLELMAVDKKATRGRTRFVLLRALGDAFLTDDVPEEALMALLSAGA